ncbi:MAG: Circadian clock protein KaiC [Gemmataceae bacterium]|nr:Circadian clock protein KaiC [Gemmataceae bacterium]
MEGLDQILAGDLPGNRLFLVEGSAGAGEATLALQFLLAGVRLGERTREAACDGHPVKPVNLPDLEKLLKELRTRGVEGPPTCFREARHRHSGRAGGDGKVEPMGDEDDVCGKSLPEGYTYLRQELRFEHTLLGSRMTYYMTSQSFLFTAAAIARATQWHGVYWISGVMLPLVGMAASGVLLFSIHAAYGRMDQWRAKEKLFEGTHPLVVP